MTYYDETNMKFPSIERRQHEREPQTMNSAELTVLSQILNGIKNGNYFEVMTKITYTDDNNIILHNIIDKINAITQNNTLQGSVQG